MGYGVEVFRGSVAMETAAEFIYVKIQFCSFFASASLHFRILDYAVVRFLSSFDLYKAISQTLADFFPL